jgi:hypothetical protein
MNTLAYSLRALTLPSITLNLVCCISVHRYIHTIAADVKIPGLRMFPTSHFATDFAFSNFGRPLNLYFASLILFQPFFYSLSFIQATLQCPPRNSLV